MLSTNLVTSYLLALVNIKFSYSLYPSAQILRVETNKRILVRIN
jgi:hypothetical protein